MASLPDEQVSLVMLAIRDRVAEHESTPACVTASDHQSWPPAGASIATPWPAARDPVRARELADEQASFERFAGGCVVCAAATAEQTFEHG